MGKPGYGEIRPIGARGRSSKRKRPRLRITPPLDHTNRRYRHKGIVNKTGRARNRTKSKVRAKGEHPFLIIRRVFGFAKVRYRGLAKNTNRRFVACGLANLFISRRRLAYLTPGGVIDIRRAPEERNSTV